MAYIVEKFDFEMVVVDNFDILYPIVMSAHSYGLAQ